MSEKTITRVELANSIYSEVGLSQQESEKILDFVLSEIINGLNQNGQVKISSFGSFYVKEKLPRIGRNPKTMEKAIISARKVISFYASNILKKAINKNCFSGE